MKKDQEKKPGVLAKTGAVLFGSGFVASALRSKTLKEDEQESDPIFATSALAIFAGMGLMFLQILADFIEFLGEKYSEKRSRP